MAIQKQYLDYTGLSVYTSNIKTYISTAIASAIDNLDVSTIALASYANSTFSFLPGMKEANGKIEADGSTNLINLGFNFNEPSSAENRNYKVQLTDNHDAYVTVPWTDTHESTTWRTIKVNGNSILASNNFTALDLIAGGGISISSDGTTGKATFSHSNSSIASVTSNSFLKFAYDAYGHITSSTAVALSDLTGLGAEASSNKTNNYASTVTDTNYFGALTVYNKIEEVRAIAQGKVKAYVTNTTKMSSLATSAASVTLSSFIDKSGATIPIANFKIGDNIYLEDENYPDRWVQSTTASNITVYKLETEKPTLANQTVTTSNVTFDASAAVQFLAGNNVSIVGNSSQKTITINSSYIDTKNTVGNYYASNINTQYYLTGVTSVSTTSSTSYIQSYAASNICLYQNGICIGDISSDRSIMNKYSFQVITNDRSANYGINNIHISGSNQIWIDENFITRRKGETTSDIIMSWPSASGRLALVDQIPTLGILNTNNTATQSTATNESFSGTINLHKISKTGSYNDLLDKPSIPTVNNGKLSIQGSGTTATEFTANQSTDVTLNIKGSGATTVSKTANNEITITSTDNDTKNTAGATWSASALYLIGALGSGTNPQTYSNKYIYASGSTLHITETASKYAELNHSQLFITDNGTDNDYASIIPGNLTLAGSKGGVLLNNGGLSITQTTTNGINFINLDINCLLFNTTNGSFGFAADFSDPSEEFAAFFAKNNIYYLPLYSDEKEVTLAVTEDLVNVGNYQMNENKHYLTGVQSYSTNNTNSYIQSYANKNIYINGNQLYVTSSFNTDVYTKVLFDGIFVYGGNANTYSHLSSSSIEFADPDLPTKRLEINSSMIEKTVGNNTYDINWPSASGTLALTSQIPVDTNTWRNIKLDGTQILGSAINTGALDFKAGANVTISWSSNKLNFSATNTYSTLNSSGVLTTPDGDTLSPITDASIQALFA